MRDLDEAERDQRRLHVWPAWDASIDAAQSRLAFDPAWTPAPGERQSPEYIRWRESVELRRLLAEAKRALIELHLSDRFTDYWLACFLAPYQRDGFSVILDPQPSGDIVATRVFPPPTEFWLEAGVDVSVAPAMLVIEGPAALASSSLLRAAERRALEAKRRAGFVKQHPLSHSRQVGPALEERARTRAEANLDLDQARRNAAAWHKAGDKPEFIAFRLGQRRYQVSERTIRRWLKEGQQKAKSDTSS